MKFRDLKYTKDAPYDCNLKGEQKFIYWHGLFNCKKLKFKDANTVIKIMDEYDPNCLTIEEKQFILKRSNKEVLCHVSYKHEDYPDIFVYGDDNIAFTTECFV
jgi:hypothetical protein